MKLRCKILISIFLFFLIITLSRYVNAESVYISETIEIKPKEIYDITSVSVSSDIVKFERKGEDGLNLDSDYITVTGIEQGTVTITIKGFKFETGTTAEGMAISVPIHTTETYTVTVINKELENAEEKIENFDNYYTKSIADVKKEGYIGVAKYLSSIMLQENSEELIDNFIKNTTKEERKNWLWLIKDHWKHGGHSGEQMEYLDIAKELLTNMVSLDNGTITEEEFEEKNEATSNNASEYYYELIKTKADIEGERLQNGVFVDILDNIDGYTKPGDLDTITGNKIGEAANKVLTAIINVGMVVAVLILAVLGIKYMLGSVEEKAEYKKDLIPYLIGACLLFGISTFVKIFMQWGEIISNL